MSLCLLDSTDGPVTNIHSPESRARPLSSVQNAGFQQCLAQLNSYMHKITPAQRTSLIEGLKHHTGPQQPEADPSQNVAGTESICISERRREEPPKLLLPSLSPFQPHACSTPCHDFLSPPPSPWFSPSFPTYAISPTFPSFASHFSHPPGLSPPSSNTSFLNLSPTLPHTGPSAFCFPPLTTARSSPHLVQRQASAPSSARMWRPWSRD